MKRIISGKPIPDWVREYDDTLLKDDARAMNYEIDDKDKGLKYIGYHKIPQDDALIDNYWNSSQNPALHKRQHDKNPNISWKIIHSGDVNECLKFERIILKKAEDNDELWGGKNQKYYNMWSGFDVDEPNDDVVERIFKNILDKKYPITRKTVNQIGKIPFYQSRTVETFEDKVRRIKQRIDDAGNSNDCDEIICLKGNSKVDDENIDGNHTYTATKRSKYGKYLDHMEIPYEEWYGLSELDKRYLCHLLNNHNEKLTTSNTEEDGIDYLLDEDKAGNSITSERVKRRLLNMGFDTTETSRCITKAKKKIAKTRNQNQGKVLINYEDEENSKKLLERKELLTTDNSFCVIRKSGAIKIGRTAITEWDKPENEGKEIMYILVNHTDDTLKENWDNSESDLQQQELDMFDCKMGTIIIQEMTPVYRSKKIKK